MFDITPDEIWQVLAMELKVPEGESEQLSTNQTATTGSGTKILRGLPPQTRVPCSSWICFVKYTRR